MNHDLDVLAKRLFRTAIEQQRCGELLECLFNNGTATVDAGTGQLILIPGSALFPEQAS